MPGTHTAAGVTMCPLVSVWLHHDHRQYTRCALVVWWPALAVFVLPLEGHVTHNGQWIDKTGQDRCVCARAYACVCNVTYDIEVFSEMFYH